MNPQGYVGRKLRQPRLHKKSAIIILTFGTTTRGAAALTLFEEKVAQRFPEHRIFWAYTSAVVRKKTGKPSLHQALALAEAENYRKVVVQPLHVFPGTEYQQIEETCHFFPGLRVVTGETLMHRWSYIEETFDIVAKEFLPDDQGLNLLVLHGTPLAADPVNIVYLGLDRFITDRYTNVRTATIEGIPDFTGLTRLLSIQQAQQCWTKVRLIPLLFLAGIHAEDDLMGKEDSWKEKLLGIGFSKVQCLSVEQKGEQYFKGLGYYPEIVELYLKRLERAIQLSEIY